MLQGINLSQNPHEDCTLISGNIIGTNDICYNDEN